MHCFWTSLMLLTAACGQGDKSSPNHGTVNLSPTAPTISVYGFPNDSPIEQADNLICEIDTQSNDNDHNTVSYTYEWSVNGTIEYFTSDTTNLTDTMSATKTSAGIWTCTVRAFDGIDYSPSTSSSLTVEPDIEDTFVYGTIAGQDGWSNLTNAYNQPDSFASGTLVENDHNDRGDSIVGPNLPEEGQIHSDEQSWWFKRGYDSPGSGTPYTPNLQVNTNDDDSDGIPDQGFRYKIAFKTADQGGDNSTVAIVTGDTGGIDRASNYIDIHNAPENLQVRTYSGDSMNIIIENLDPTLWHTLEATMTRVGMQDYWTYRINGTEVLTDEPGYFSEYRILNGFEYTESSRIKFQPRHSNHIAVFQGFFFDDVITQTLDANSGMVIDSYNTGFE